MATKSDVESVGLNRKSFYPGTQAGKAGCQDSGTA